jgi:uncharacterized protein YbjT (DUF2867 family)
MTAADIVREVVRGRIARGELPADSLEQMGLDAAEPLQITVGADGAVTCSGCGKAFDSIAAALGHAYSVRDAAEALRRARATMDCPSGGLRYAGVCPLGAEEYEGGPLARLGHIAFASALLDGYTVEELTEAGG